MSDQLPAGWTRQPIGSIAQVLVSTVDKKEYDGESPVRVANYTDVYYADEIVDDATFLVATASDAQIRAFSVRAFDVAITKDSETSDDIGNSAIAISNLPGVVWGYHLAIYRARDARYARFIKRLFDSTMVKADLAARTPGVTRVGLSSNTLRYLRVPVPPPDRAVDIADFLDVETAEIDAFIADQEELITLLEERRAQQLALLFGSVAMPSAASSRFGRFVSEKDVRVNRSEHQLLSVSIHRGVEPAGSGSETAPPGYKLVRKGDIVLNRMRAFQGAVGYSRFDGGVSPDYAVLIVAPGVDGRFVGELMRSRPFVSRMTSLLRGIGGQESGVVRTPRVNTRDLLSIEVNMPGLADQRESVSRVHAIRASAESAIADAREAIALSKERRAALISAAVTGQIDVSEKKRVLV